jgi:hypothetical protein
MKDILLSKTFLTFGSLPKASHVNPNLLLALLLDDHIHHKKGPDIKLTYNKQQTWLIHYLTAKFITEHPDYGGFHCKELFGNVEVPGESSLKRNHYLKHDLGNTPSFTGMYFLNGSGEVLIDNDDPPHMNQVFHADIVPGRFLIFNSFLNYKRTINEGKEPRASLIAAFGR